MEIPPNPHCGAKLKRGDGTCGKPAGWGTDHVGWGNCRLHAGSTTTGRKHAKQLRQEAWDRILELTDPALLRIKQLIDGAETDTVRLAAARDILDRAGLGARHVHEHTGPDGGPIPVEVRAAELLGRARKLRPPAAGKPPTRKKAPAKRVEGKGRNLQNGAAEVKDP